MPRGRGGPRVGTPGKTYPNRTDMPGARATLPVSTVKGQQYGAASQQAAAQAVVPMGNPTSAPTVAAPAQVPVGGAPAGLGPPPPPLPGHIPPPGTLQPLNAPTDRPGEHVATGSPVGPGPGLEALSPMPPAAPLTGAPPMTTAMFLQHLASQPGAPAEIVALAQSANQRG